MMKIKYMLNRTMGAVAGAALTAPMMLNVVSATNEDTADLMNVTMDGDKLNVPGAENGTQGTTNMFNIIFSRFRLIISGITGVLSLALVVIFAYKAFNLAKSSDSPQERAKSIQGLIFYFIGAACFGAASFFAGLGYNLLR